MLSPRTVSIACAVLGGLIGLAGSAAADTFASAQWYFGANQDYQTGVSSAAIPLQSFDLDNHSIVGAVSATAHADYLSLGSSAAFSTTNSLPTPVIEGLARATAETLDIFTAHGLPAGTAGFLVYKASLSGSNTATLGPTNAGEQITWGGAEVHTSVIGYRGTVAEVGPLTGLAPLYDYPVYLPAFTGVQYMNVPIELAFPIQYETPAAFYVLMTSIAKITFDPSVAETFDGASGFLDTFTIDAIELQDANHQPVPGAALTAASGTVYPGVGSVTTTSTTPGGSTTTTTLFGADCAGLSGLAHAQCLIAAAVAGPLCSDPIPPGVTKAFVAQLTAAGNLLERAGMASGRKQARLVKAVRHKLAALAKRATAAAKSKKPKRRISAACGASIGQLAGAAADDLP